MTVTEYRQSLNKILNDASESVVPPELLRGLVDSLASVMAIASLMADVNRDDAMTVIQHQLDIAFIKALEVYKDASQPKTA